MTLNFMKLIKITLNAAFAFKSTVLITVNDSLNCFADLIGNVITTRAVYLMEPYLPWIDVDESEGKTHWKK